MDVQASKGLSWEGDWRDMGSYKCRGIEAVDVGASKMPGESRYAWGTIDVEGGRKVHRKEWLPGYGRGDFG